MELIKGNMMLILAITAMVVFLLSWAQFYEGAFHQAFIHYRRKLLMDELRYTTKLIALISILSIFLYYLLCALLHCQAVPFIHTTFAPCFLVAAYLMLYGASLRKLVALVACILMVLVLSPVIIFTVIIVYRVKLDYYLGYFSIIFFLFDILFGLKILQYWKEGDL